MSVRTRIGHCRRTPRLLKPGLLLAAVVLEASALHAQVLPDAPSSVLGYAIQTLSSPPAQQQPNPLPPDIAAPAPAPDANTPPPCDKTQRLELKKIPWLIRAPDTVGPCRMENPLQEIVSSKNVLPLTPELKGYLAIRDVVDPFNLITILGYSGIYVAANSHSAYGPGFDGWGKLAGYSLLEDMQSEFFGTFAIPSLVHEDPRYHRMPDAPVRRRIVHALIHTVISQHDDGRPMLNYATLLTYPISAELSNLYVPGLAVNAPSTAKRIAAGYATDPIGPLIAEFLPDIARHIHIRVVFVQQILQQVANRPSTQ
jgi:hypothetical protein